MDYDTQIWPKPITISERAIFIDYVVNISRTSIFDRTTKLGAHNIGLPAVRHNSEVVWAIDGDIYYMTKQYCEAAYFDDETTVFWLLAYGTDLPSKFEDVKELSFTFIRDLQ